MIRRAQALCGILLLSGGNPLWAQKGYDLRNDQIVVDQARHWERWTMPAHLVRVAADGAVRARNFRTVYELLSDQSFGRPVTLTRSAPRIANMDSTLRLDFQGNSVADLSGNLIYDYLVRPGASRAGSNPHLMQHIADGDPDTFWEPNLDDSPEDWWVEVDLGRPVPLERVRLSFVAEALGDPFYRFILLLGPTQGNYADETPGNLETFIPFEGVNAEQRTFVFDAERVSADLPADDRVAQTRRLPVTDSNKHSSAYYGVAEPSPEWNGKLVEIIRIVVTDTRGGRAEPISEEQWQARPAEERGAIVYFLKDGDFEEPVDEDTYFALPADRQGRRVHYRRELPRLAEWEAWGRGDEIGIEILSGGGTVEQTSTGGAPAAMFDGSYGSANQLSTYLISAPGQNTLTVDMGGTVWLQEIRTISQNPPRGYVLRGSNGTRDAQGNLQWEQLSAVERETNVDNGYFRLVADVLAPARRVRFLDMIAFALQEDSTELTSRVWPRIRLMWLFSEGPPAEVVLESDLIELPGVVALGAVRWAATAPPGSEVQIRTRTGDQLVERIRYFDKTGNEKTKSQHRRLSFTQKGPIDTSNVAGPGWSTWSRKYERSGDPATSPGLRRFLKIQVRLVNHDRQAVPGIEQISVDLRTPVAQRLGAEVWPERVPAGRLDTFEVFVQPSFLEQPASSHSPGFDEVLVRADPPIELRVIDLAVGTEPELSGSEPAQLFERPYPGGIEAADGQVLQVLSEGDSLWLRLPAPMQSVPAGLLPRLYYRQLDPGDEVPTGLDGRLLTTNSHNRLPENERGAIRHFRRVGAELEEVASNAYQSLSEEEKGPVRYFRVVTSLGEQTVFTALGDSLSDSQYAQLSTHERGRVVGLGRLLRLRFSAAVYLPSTQLEVAVRHSSLAVLWQGAADQDVTTLRPASALAIQAGETGDVVANLSITPNPFTPNGDGVNDEAQIRFALFAVAVSRSVAVRIYSLGGDLVRRLDRQLVGGPQVVAWNGRDDRGGLVAPGLYLCQVGAAADAKAGRRKRDRVIAVAY